MLLDEPTSAPDPKMIKEVLNVIQELAQTGITIVVVTHEMGCAREAADRICFFEFGNLVEIGPPDQLFHNPQHERTKLYLSQILHQ